MPKRLKIGRRSVVFVAGEETPDWDWVGTGCSGLTSSAASETGNRWLKNRPANIKHPICMIGLDSLDELWASCRTDRLYISDISRSPPNNDRKGETLSGREGHKGVEKRPTLWEFTYMKTLKMDAQKRIRLPDFEPQTVFAYANNGDGTVTLTQVVAEVKEAFPPGSLLKYITPEYNAELLERYEACYHGPPEEME